MAGNSGLLPSSLAPQNRRGLRHVKCSRPGREAGSEWNPAVGGVGGNQPFLAISAGASRRCDFANCRQPR